MTVRCFNLIKDQRSFGNINCEMNFKIISKIISFFWLQVQEVNEILFQNKIQYIRVTVNIISNYM